MSPRTLRIRERAEADLLELVEYFARAESGLADAFIEAVVDTASQLTVNPSLGRSVDTTSPLLAGLRWRRVSSRFASYLIFYVPTESSIEVMRVLHGARDLPTLMDKPEER